MSNGDFVKRFILEHPIISWCLAGSVLGTIKSILKREAPVVNVYNGGNANTAQVADEPEEEEEETEEE